MPAPVNTVLPAITGTAEVGQTLTVSNGTWTGGVQSYAYQWQRVGPSVEDSGENATAYAVTALDSGATIRCVVTATNADGSTSATSAATAAVSADWFVVEDGTGLDDAVTYCSVSDADMYHAQRGHVDWSSLPSGQKKAALALATDFIEGEYAHRFTGTRNTLEQALSWPRVGARILGFTFPSDEIPRQLRDACAAMALKAVTEDLIPDLTTDSAVTSETVVGAVSVTYSESRKPLVPLYRIAAQMLSPLLDSVGGMNFGVSRV